MESFWNKKHSWELNFNEISCLNQHIIFDSDTLINWNIYPINIETNKLKLVNLSTPN